MRAMTPPIIFAAALIASTLAGAAVQGWRMNAQMADLRAEHATHLRETAEAKALVIRQQQADRLSLERSLTELDTRHHKELSHAQKAVDTLATDLLAAHRRLSVRTTTPRCDVSTATGTAGMDARSERADIHPEDAAALVRLAGDADACAVKLTALQAWVRRFLKQD